LHVTPGPNSPGASTTANGIVGIEAVNGGTTAESAFRLAGEVRAGFYDYRLYRGGFNGTNPNDWFLRSIFNGGNGNGGNGNGGGNGGNGNGGNGPITPPTLHERIGETLAIGNVGSACSTSSVWAAASASRSTIAMATSAMASGETLVCATRGNGVRIANRSKRKRQATTR
jgi:hypothetical protein